MIDKINNTSQIVRDAQDKAINKIIEYSTPKTIISLLELLMAVMCLVGVQIISYSFDFSVVLRVDFWIKLSCSIIGIVLLFRSVVTLRQSSTEKRDNVVKARNEYIELNSKKKLDLKLYLKEFNLGIKTEMYVAKINTKIYKVEKKLYRTKNNRKYKRLADKMEKLKGLISVEYIEKNIEHIRIKYNEVFWTDFNDVDIQGESNGAFLTRGTANYNRSFAKATFKNIWLYILTTTMIAIGLPTPMESSFVSYFSTIGLSLLLIVVRIAQAILSADRIYDATITRSYIDRSTILKQYYEWRKANPGSNAFTEQLEQEKKKIEDEVNQKWKEHYRAEAERLLQEGMQKMRN